MKDRNEGTKRWHLVIRLKLWAWIGLCGVGVVLLLNEQPWDEPQLWWVNLTGFAIMMVAGKRIKRWVKELDNE